MKRAQGLLSIFFALGFSFFVPLLAEEGDSEFVKAATAGKNKIIVVGRHEKKDGSASTTLPDLLFFKDGRIEEAWNLQITDTSLKYLKKGPKTGKLVAVESHKQQLLAVHFSRSFDEYLQEQQTQRQSAAANVTSANTQPVRQTEVLAGRFVARQGKFTRWTFDFTSQLNKFYTDAKSATEYGTFVLRSHMRQQVSKTLHENEVIAKGKYFLFAPGVFGNKEWVLNLTEVAYTENDLAPEQSIFTQRLADEVFIMKLSDDTNVFRLEWTNQPGWQWTSPTQQKFFRTEKGSKNRSLSKS